MAILTASGRAALAAAIKEQTLHLALGEGDPLWDTTKAISTSFDEAGVIELGFQHLADIRVTSLDDHWADPDLNSPQSIQDGKIYFNFDFTPPYPAEHIIFRSHLVDDYLEEIL